MVGIAESVDKVIPAPPLLLRSIKMSGDQVISYIVNTLEVREATIAAMLDVTTKTLDSWKHLNLDQTSGKSLRLKALHDVIKQMHENIENSAVILNLLNDPLVEIQKEGCSTLLHIINESPDDKDISVCADKLVENYTG